MFSVKKNYLTTLEKISTILWHCNYKEKNLKIKIEDILKGQLSNFNFEIDRMDGLDLIKLEIIGTAVYENHKYVVTGNYNAIMKLECVRCLTPIEREIEGEFKGIYLDPKEYKKYLAELKPEEEITAEFYEEAVNGEINISDLVREFIILDLPQMESCYPECTDSSSIEKYSKDEIDPRWQQLLEINKN